MELPIAHELERLKGLTMRAQLPSMSKGVVCLKQAYMVADEDRWVDQVLRFVKLNQMKPASWLMESIDMAVRHDRDVPVG